MENTSTLSSFDSNKAFGQSATPYLEVSPVSNITNGNTYDKLGGAKSTAVVTINGSVYALILSSKGLSVIDITIPNTPLYVDSTDSLFDGTNDHDVTNDILSSVTPIRIDGTTYAIISATIGFFVLNMTNLTDYFINDNIIYVKTDPREFQSNGDVSTVEIENEQYAILSNAKNNGYLHSLLIVNIKQSDADIKKRVRVDENLKIPMNGIAVTKINSDVYILATSSNDDAFTITKFNEWDSHIIIHDEDSEYETLDGAMDVTTITIDDKTYALVAAYDDDGVQIIDISSPNDPTSVSSIVDGVEFTKLKNPTSITTVTMDNFHYALVASEGDNGVQIIDITNPSLPTTAYAITDSTLYPTLGGANDVITTKINGFVYAIVTASEDNGIQIIKLEHIPLLDSLTISSDNQHHTHAKESNTITIYLKVNRNIIINEAKILNHVLDLGLDVINDGAIIKFKTIVDNTAMYKPVNFAINVSDGSNSIVFTEHNLTDQNVLVDTIRPIITVPDNPITLNSGNSEMFFNAIVYDEYNLYYDEIVTIVSFNINLTTITDDLVVYTALPDAAGNWPLPVSRNIHVTGESIIDIINTTVAGIDTTVIETSMQIDDLIENIQSIYTTNNTETYCGKPIFWYNVINNSVDSTIHGTDGNDLIIGSGQNIIIRGYAGDDCIIDNNFSNTIYGDNGVDVIHGWGGDDTIYGGLGNDVIYGRGGDDEMYGGRGNDVIYSGNGNDEIYGELGNDVIYGGNGDDTIRGGHGNDVLYGHTDIINFNSAYEDDIHGGLGDDEIYGGDGNDILNGWDGDDLIHGYGGDDIIYGYIGDDEIHGWNGNDILCGGLGDDDMYGFDGIDRVYGGPPNYNTVAGVSGSYIDKIFDVEILMNYCKTFVEIPDLEIVSFSTDPNPSILTQIINYELVVRNNGPGFSPPTTVTIYDPLDIALYSQTINIPYLQPGQSHMIDEPNIIPIAYVDTPYTFTGLTSSRILESYIDLQNTISETNENNNNAGITHVTNGRVIIN